MKKRINHKNECQNGQNSFGRWFKWCLSFVTLWCLPLMVLHAEGIPELKPTNDDVRLIINRSEDLGGNRTNFAGWGNTDPFSRLYINITDPSRECLFIGLGISELNLPYTDDHSPEFHSEQLVNFTVFPPAFRHSEHT